MINASKTYFSSPFRGVGILSILALIGAFIAQYIFGMMPCSLCFYERFIYMGLVGICLISFFGESSFFFYIMMLLIGGGLSLGVYHLGVESLWWKAPPSCTGASISAVDLDDFYAQFLQQSTPRCDKVTWTILGISATLWNIILLFCMGIYAVFNRPSLPLIK